MFDFHKNTSFNLKVRFFSFESLKPLCLFSNGGFSEINSTVKWVFTPQKLRKNLDGAYIKDVVAESDPTAEPT
ncbi:unnamed protein product [Brassica rapa subsp. narinosa]